jgi:hypothetical protein
MTQPPPWLLPCHLLMASIKPTFLPSSVPLPSPTSSPFMLSFFCFIELAVVYYPAVFTSFGRHFFFGWRRTPPNSTNISRSFTSLELQPSYLLALLANHSVIPPYYLLSRLLRRAFALLASNVCSNLPAIKVKAHHAH